VLTVAGWSQTLEQALGRAYARAERIDFEGRHYRRDIGARARRVNA
jgi:phosphoribosylamine-glycine ligase